MNASFTDYMSLLKRIILIPVLITFCFGCKVDKEPFLKKTFTAQDGQVLPYRILYPEDYSPDKEYPLVLFLHGAGERGDDNEKQLVHGMDIYLQSKNRKDYPCFVLAPQCSEDSYWSVVDIDRSSYPLSLSFKYDQKMTDALSATIQLLAETINNEGIDKDRIYITGLSMGGMGTFEAVQRHPDYFAAAAPVCGGGDPNAYDSTHVDIPFWIFHGDADAVVSVDESRKMHSALIDNGNQVKYSEYSGVKHNSWENAYAEKDFLPWLFSHRKAD